MDENRKKARAVAKSTTAASFRLERECDVADAETMDAVNAPDLDLDPDMAAAWAAAQVLHKHGIDGATYEKLIALPVTGDRDTAHEEETCRPQ